MNQANDKKAAVAESLRIAVDATRRARDLVKAIGEEEGLLPMGLDVATFIALCPPLTAAAAKLAKELDPHPARRAKRRK